ncbi:MAG: AAA family ATPase [Desulfosoma sp.]
MYTDHFGLKTLPFSLTPDPEFLYLSRVHDLALTHLEYALVHRAGFVALTGEIGAGKTTLLKHLLTKLPEDLDVAVVFNTNLDPVGFLEMLAKEFGIAVSSSRKSDLFQSLYRHFLDRYAQGRRCLIVVDEAQNLPLETLEEVRMLSNLEADSDFLIQIILVGQPEMRRRLARPELAQLAQRISVHYHLQRLSEEEVGRYIHHRLRVAGHSDPPRLFGADVLNVIAEKTAGVPRLINALCDACLTYAYGENRDRVSADIVRQVLADSPFLWEERPEGESRDETDMPPSEPPPARGDMSLERFGRLLTECTLRLDALERRLALVESDGRGASIQTLRNMLAEERERNKELEKKLLLSRTLIAKLRNEQVQKKEQAAPPPPPEPPPRKPFWRSLFEKDD